MVDRASRPSESESPWPEAVMAVSSFGRTLVARVFGKSTATALVAVYVVYAIAHTVEFWLLPEAERSEAARIAGLDAITRALSGADWFSWGGWVLSCALSLGGLLFFQIQHKRIVRQGEELAAFRHGEDPDRLSSRDPDALGTYVDIGSGKKEGSADS